MWKTYSIDVYNYFSITVNTDWNASISQGLVRKQAHYFSREFNIKNWQVSTGDLKNANEDCRMKMPKATNTPGLGNKGPRSCPVEDGGLWGGHMPGPCALLRRPKRPVVGTWRKRQTDARDRPLLQEHLMLRGRELSVTVHSDRRKGSSRSLLPPHAFQPPSSTPSWQSGKGKSWQSRPNTATLSPEG